MSAGQPDGTFTLAVGVFDITNSNATGAKLGAGASSNYSVTVETPTPSDNTPPAISYVLNPASPDGSNGWYTGNVTLTWTVTENESPGSLVKTGCVDQNITADQTEVTYSCSATSDGGSAGPVEVKIKRDATKPTASAAATSGPDGNNNWYVSNVMVSFTCDDATSGVASCPSDQVLSTDGNSVSSTAQTATDYAGNISDPSNTVTVMIDKTKPVVAVTGVIDGATYVLGSVPVAGCDTTDATSGVATAAILSTTGGPVVGSFTATCSGAADNAGNTGSATATYTVIFAFAGFFQPIDMDKLNAVKAGSAVPIKFSLGGDQGLSIFAVGYPSSTKINCASSTAEDDVTETVNAGGSSLTYDPVADQYVYVWKTDKSWAGTCRRLVVQLTDGTIHTADFKFK